MGGIAASRSGCAPLKAMQDGVHDREHQSAMLVP
jgi:hypothetical protein